MDRSLWFTRVCAYLHSMVGHCYQSCNCTRSFLVSAVCYNASPLKGCSHCKNKGWTILPLPWQKTKLRWSVKSYKGDIWKEAARPHLLTDPGLLLQCFLENRTAKENLLKSYKLMLDFYGIELRNEQTGKVERASNWSDRFNNLNKWVWILI